MNIFSDIHNSNSIKNILVRAPNWIGDAVLCLPSIDALRSVYPSAEITVLAKPWVSPVFFNNPFVKRIIDYEASGRHNGIAGKRRLIQELKQYGFDAAVLFQNAFEAALISFLARIPVRIGYDKDFRGLLLTHPVRLDSDIKKTHQVFYYLNIVADLSKSRQPSAFSHHPKIYLTEEEKDWAKNFLNDQGIGSGIVAGMAPGASYGPAKRWMPDRFREVAKRFIHNYGAKIVLFGGKDDNGICNDLFNGIGREAILKGLNLAGEVALRKSIALISRCHLFITNDSGLMHIAASLGVPTVAIFGSTDPNLTGPIGDKAVIIKKDIECSPCFERECRYGHYNCFKMVAANDVYEASVRFIKEFANA
ncbi:MAG: lipopolysaccharide heptosyltransferase II [Deltaproteobacteria bacterium]|nr:lipopolysaccharide heptosyltransferase II [Deltaproteobacteria bacterium]